MKAVSLRSLTAYWGAIAVVAACGGSSDTQASSPFQTGPDATTGSSGGSGNSSGGSSGNNYSSSGGGSSSGSGDDSSVGTNPPNGCPSTCSADADCQNMCSAAAMGSTWCCMAGTCAQASGTCPSGGDAGDNG